MKKITIIILITILLKLFLPINPYIECNNIKIIKEIEIDCNNKKTYKEIIPIKEDNGIKYKYKTYSKKEKNFFLKKAKIKREDYCPKSPPLND